MAIVAVVVARWAEAPEKEKGERRAPTQEEKEPARAVQSVMSMVCQARVRERREVLQEARVSE